MSEATQFQQKAEEMAYGRCSCQPAHHQDKSEGCALRIEIEKALEEAHNEAIRKAAETAENFECLLLFKHEDVDKIEETTRVRKFQRGQIANAILSLQTGGTK